MAWIITKYLLTAGMVVFISEVAKRSDKLGGFIAALPLMTLLTLIWLFIENQSEEKRRAYQRSFSFGWSRGNQRPRNDGAQVSA